MNINATQCRSKNDVRWKMIFDLHYSTKNETFARMRLWSIPFVPCIDPQRLKFIAFISVYIWCHAQKVFKETK